MMAEADVQHRTVLDDVGAEPQVEERRRVCESENWALHHVSTSKITKALLNFDHF